MKNKKLIETLEFIIPAILMMTMMLIVCMQVGLRFFLKPLSWPEEITRWCLIWITFGGASYGFVSGAFISVDFFIKKLFPSKFGVIKLFDSIITSIFFAICAISGFLYTLSTIRNGTLMPVTKVPVAISNSAIFIGFFLGTFRSLYLIADEYKNINDEGETS